MSHLECELFEHRTITNMIFLFSFVNFSYQVHTCLQLWEHFLKDLDKLPDLLFYALSVASWLLFKGDLPEL